MIKSTKTPIAPSPAPDVAFSDAEIEEIAKCLSVLGDSERREKVRLIDRCDRLIRENENRIESYENDIAELRDEIEEAEEKKEDAEADMDDLPPSKEITPEGARAEIVRLSSLPYVKSIRYVAEDNRPYLEIVTRENALFTTLTKKYSRNERWYSVKPYKIPLPAYKIRLGLWATDTYANNSALLIALAKPKEDTAHFIGWSNRYVQEVHAHWGATSMNSDQTGSYRQLCLGEYEGEIATAFRRGITEGMIALAIYLQNAGADHSHVRDGRERWALWLGKKEYNEAIIPSEKEAGSKVDNDGEEEDRMRAFVVGAFNNLRGTI